MSFTHLNERGEANMVDVSSKLMTEREARAESFITVDHDTLIAICSDDNPKGDVFSVARIAGIQAAKNTANLIPLCHSLALSKVSIDFEIINNENKIRVEALCKLSGQTGVEMEALTAASIASLTIYDMCKAFDKGMVIGPTQLLTKSGGKSGDWIR